MSKVFYLNCEQVRIESYEVYTTLHGDTEVNIIEAEYEESGIELTSAEKTQLAAEYEAYLVQQWEHEEYDRASDKYYASFKEEF